MYVIIQIGQQCVNICPLGKCIAIFLSKSDEIIFHDLVLPNSQSINYVTLTNSIEISLGISLKK